MQTNIARVEYLGIKDFYYLTLKSPTRTATDGKFCDILVFGKNKVRYFIRIVCQQMILMKYHALSVIFEKSS